MFGVDRLVGVVVLDLESACLDFLLACLFICAALFCFVFLLGLSNLVQREFIRFRGVPKY